MTAEGAAIEQVGWITAELLQALRDKRYQGVTIWSEPCNWPSGEANIPLYAVVVSGSSNSDTPAVTQPAQKSADFGGQFADEAKP